MWDTLQAGMRHTSIRPITVTATVHRSDNVRLCNFAQSQTPSPCSACTRRTLSFLLPLLPSNVFCSVVVISFRHGREASSTHCVLSPVLEV